MVVLVGQTVVSSRFADPAHSYASQVLPNDLVQENVRLKRTMRVVKTIQARQSAQRTNYSPLVVIAALTELKQELSGMMQVNALNFSVQSTPRSSSKSPGTNDEHGYVVVSIQTDSPSNSANIVQALQQNRLFREVKLQSGLEQKNTSGDLQCSIRCAF